MTGRTFCPLSVIKNPLELIALVAAPPVLLATLIQLVKFVLVCTV